MTAPTILSDEECRRRADMGALVEVIESALRAHADGRLVAPPRFHVPFGDRGDLAFTCGGELGGTDAAGFRVYDRFHAASPDRSQLVAVFNSRTGAFVGAVVGSALGALRTGAIGGTAVRAMSRPESQRLAVIGTGTQARTQILAAAYVREVTDVRVFGRDPTRRAQFCEALSVETGLAVNPAASARAAIGGADIVITATNSGEPVIDPEWPVELADRAASIVSDAPGQLAAYGDTFLLAGHPALGRLRALSEIVADPRGLGRRGDDLSLFISTGLAGTEVLVAEALLRVDVP